MRQGHGVRARQSWKRVVSFGLAAALSLFGLTLVAPVAYAVDGEVTHVGSASTAGNRTAHTVRIPAEVLAGDVLVLAMVANSTSGTLTEPAGWTVAESVDGNGVRGRLWTRTAGVADANTNVTVTTSAILKSALSVTAYRSSIGFPTLTASEAAVVNTSATSHTAPAVALAGAGSWLVDIWGEKSTTDATWTLPAEVVSRTTAAATGTGRVSLVVGDSNAAVPGPISGTPVATTSVAVSRGVQFSLAITPGSDGAPVNVPPTPAFTNACVGLDCSFDASTSTDPEGSPLTFAWNFGDGTTATGVTAAHTYATPGTRTVTLTVSDGLATSVLTRQVTTALVVNAPPVPAFTSSCVLLVCSFDASTSTDPEGSPLTFAWDFGDGTTGTGVTATRTYATAGTRTVTLTASDGAATAQTTRQVTSVTPIAGPGHTVEVSDTVRTNFPRITTGEIFDLEYIGNRVYVVGTFTTIRNNATGNTTSYNQPYLAAFNMTTGLVDTGFRPVFDGGVTDVEASPDGTRLYVAGRFNTVNGVTKRKFAALDPATGATIASFTAHANGAGTELEATNTTVYLGGQFTQINGANKIGLAAVDAATGALVGRTNANPAGTWNNDITGGIGPNGALNVQELKLTPDLTTLMVVHTGRQIAGQDRYGVGLINAGSGALLPWRTRLWEDNLGYVGGVQRAYAGDISPDGTYMVITSGSGGDRPPINDTAVRFPIAGGDFVEPTWVSRLYDSVYSVAISEVAIYLGGHFSWVESQSARDPWPGLDNVGYGTGQGLSGYGLGDEVLRRDHVTSIAPDNGKALQWNPGSNSFEGNKAMLVTPRGLVTGGDATTQGAQNVGRIAVYDLLSTATQANNTTITSPVEGRVEEAAVPFTIEGTAVATSGVNRVQIEVRNRSTNRYLQDDLVTWGAANTINATLASPGATSTTWSLGLTITGNLSLEAMARTVATNGQSDTTKDVNRFETFSTTDATPRASVTGPSGILPSTTFLATGTATDDVGVQSLSYTIRDVNNRYLQADGSATSTYNSFSLLPDVVGSISTTWSVEITVPWEGEWKMQVIARDTAGQSSLDTSDRTWIISSTGIAPSVAVTAPVVMTPPVAVGTVTVAPGSPITFSGTATDDEGLANVEITLRNTTTREGLAADGTWGINLSGAYRITPINVSGTSTSWSYTTPFNLTPGSYSFTVRATDDLGLVTSSTNQGRLTLLAQIPGDVAPDALLTAQATPTVLHLDLAGTATDDFGVQSVMVAVYDNDTRRYLQPNGTMSAAYATLASTLASPGGTSTTWNLSVDLPTEGNWTVTAFAFDTAGQQDTSTTGATASFRIYPGDLPPVVLTNLQIPVTGAVFPTGKIVISGRVEDDRQIASAQIAVVNSLGQYMSATGTFTSTTESWRSAFLNSPGSPGSNFSFTTPVIPPGTYTVRVRGVDQHSLATNPTYDTPGVIVEHPANNLPPVAAFTFRCGAVLTGAPTDNVCEFDARTSTDENTPDLRYGWTFGTATSTGAVVRRTFTAPGDVTVTLTATDEFGLTAVTSQIVTVVEPPTNLPPVAVLSPPACTGLVCNFSSASSTDPNVGDVLTRLWVWGDGTANSTTTSLAHTFPAAGTYTVSLTVTDGWGDATTVTLPVTVVAP